LTRFNHGVILNETAGQLQNPFNIDWAMCLLSKKGFPLLYFCVESS